MSTNNNKHRYCKKCGVVVANVNNGTVERLPNMQVIKSNYYCKGCAKTIK
jgi:uncharacterized protein with PIN domain